MRNSLRASEIPYINFRLKFESIYTNLFWELHPPLLCYKNKKTYDCDVAGLAIND
jgi:hypothetical protein